MDMYWQLDILPPTTEAEVPIAAGCTSSPVEAAAEAAAQLGEACARWGRADFRVLLGDAEILATPAQTTTGVVVPLTAADLLRVVPHLIDPTSP